MANSVYAGTATVTVSNGVASIVLSNEDVPGSFSGLQEGSIIEINGGTGFVASNSGSAITSVAGWGGASSTSPVPWTAQPKSDSAALAVTSLSILQTLTSLNTLPSGRMLKTSARETLIGMDCLVGCYLTSMTATDPPDHAATGTAYLVPVGATGDWKGFVGSIAYATGKSWSFYSPFNGLMAYCAEDDRLYVRKDGVFVDLATSQSLWRTTDPAVISGKTIFTQSVGIGNQNPEEKLDVNGLVYSNGLRFRSAAVPSSDPNVLDDYEEGSWTPILTAVTPPTGVTYWTQYGHYIKIGSLVILTFGIHINSTGTGGAGTVKITGLPFSQIMTGSYAEAAVFLGAQGNFASKNTAGAVGFFVWSNDAVMEGRILNTNGDTGLPWSEIVQGTFIGREIMYFAS